MEREIQSTIITIKGQRAVSDSDHGRMFAVSTARLDEQVTRSPRIFPKDFMFQLSLQELKNVMSRVFT